MTEVLFICTANVSRSPFVELLARIRVGDRLELRSAGTHGTDGRAIDEYMAAELAARGVDAAGFTSTRLTPAHVARADVVLTAESVHRTFVLEEHPAKLRRTFTLGQLARALPEVPTGLAGEELWSAAHRVQATADPVDDVADPFGQGRSAATAAAERLDDLLGEILPRLVVST